MTNHQPTIVVGVDGSEASAEALRWAAGQAEQTGARLQVITAWRQPVPYGVPVDYSDVDFEKEARRKAETVLAEVLGSEPVVPVETQVSEGHAAPILVDAARGADLLVVGSHGHGAFVGMLLGSTSQHCAQHASCPIVIVRHPARP
jgi:nucleotide-binding universal stress UspA family protein